MKCDKKFKNLVRSHPIIRRLFTLKKLISESESKIPKRLMEEIEHVKHSMNSGIKLDFITEEEPKADKKKAKKVVFVDDEEMLDEELDDANDEFNDLDEEEKRAITYEIAKNKGLTPKRKREQRNPRVKYRRKFEKAVVRRKGQVREPRKELKKYGGEFTGINVHSVKSVRFK